VGSLADSAARRLHVGASRGQVFLSGIPALHSTLVDQMPRVIIGLHDVKSLPGSSKRNAGLLITAGSAAYLPPAACGGKGEQPEAS